jgi:hypothetical protein
MLGRNGTLRCSGDRVNDLDESADPRRLAMRDAGPTVGNAH